MTSSQRTELAQIIRLSAMDPDLARALVDLVEEIERNAATTALADAM
jgi:hypothetical protein